MGHGNSGRLSPRATPFVRLGIRKLSTWSCSRHIGLWPGRGPNRCSSTGSFLVAKWRMIPPTFGGEDHYMTVEHRRAEPPKRGVGAERRGDHPPFGNQEGASADRKSVVEG